MKVVFSPKAHARSTIATSRAHSRYPASPDARPRSKKVFSKSSQSAGRRALQATTGHPRPKDLQHSADGPVHRKSRQTVFDNAIGFVLASRSKFENVWIVENVRDGIKQNGCPDEHNPENVSHIVRPLEANKIIRLFRCCLQRCKHQRGSVQ